MGEKDQRIVDHPVLGTDRRKERVEIEVDGRKLEAIAGEPILTAILASGKRVCRRTSRFGEDRGAFCGIGRCTDCVMVVDGVANVRTCVTPVKDGMRISTQDDRK